MKIDESTILNPAILERVDTIEMSSTHITLLLPSDKLEYRLRIEHFRVQLDIWINGRAWWTGIDVDEEPADAVAEFWAAARQIQFDKEQESNKQRIAHAHELIERLVTGAKK